MTVTTRMADHGHGGPHESPMVMIVPLMILAVLSFVGGWVGVPAALGGSDHFDHFLDPGLPLDGALPPGDEAASRLPC